MLLGISMYIGSVWSRSYTFLIFYVKYGKIDLSAGSVALRSDSADVQTDLEQHCLHIACDKFRQYCARITWQYCSQWYDGNGVSHTTPRSQAQKWRSHLEVKGQNWAYNSTSPGCYMSWWKDLWISQLKLSLWLDDAWLKGQVYT